MAQASQEFPESELPGWPFHSFDTFDTTNQLRGFGSIQL
jgi:hypothetical protein